MPRAVRHQYVGMSNAELTKLVKQIMSDNAQQNPVYIPGPQGERGIKGEAGETGAPGESVTEAQVEALVDAWLSANPPAPGKDAPAITPEQIATAVAEFLSVNPPHRGLKGDPGSPGAKGDKGEKGDKGDPGNTGPAGPQGAQGIPGIQGLKGDTGSVGATGAPGPQGIQGNPGPTGPVGAAAFVQEEIGAANVPALVLGGSTNVTVALSGAFPDTDYRVLKPRFVSGNTILGMLSATVTNKTVNSVTLRITATGLASSAGIVFVDCYRSGA